MVITRLVTLPKGRHSAVPMNGAKYQVQTDSTAARKNSTK